MRGGLFGVVTLLAVVVMIIFGGMFLSGIAAEVAEDDVSNSAFSGVSEMVKSLYGVVQSVIPVFVWLIIIAVIVYAVYRLTKYR